MKKLKIKKDDKRVFVSQLFGMSDNISFNLAKEGYNVAKYVPYGPIKDLIPYLIRRADENKSISGQMGRELNNISKELNRRKNNSILNNGFFVIIFQNQFLNAITFCLETPKPSIPSSISSPSFRKI